MKRLSKSLIVILGLLFTSNYVWAQLPEESKTVTTFVLIRHAEKESDGTKDPALTAEGRQRAQDLAQLLSQANISAIYSTPFQRTRQTVQMLAKDHQLEILEYDPFEETVIQEMINRHPGGLVVISGHSNTTPQFVNQLIGEERYPQLDESDYGNIFMVTTEKIGKGTVIQLRY
jgi:phosphohistidine phosphatase SixA